jgi:hypothetical protein
VLSSTDPDGGKWELVKPEDVPEEIKALDVMGNLVIGNEMATIPGTGVWYRAEKANAIEV